jgi:hypothetical protein
VANVFTGSVLVSEMVEDGGQSGWLDERRSGVLAGKSAEISRQIRGLSRG